MLNLSDKELDRLSKEAAQEYDPGDVLGPNAWERLQVRLDTGPGGGSPNPLRHIRRWPFYYTPALLVLLGISYYYLTKHPPASDRLAKTVNSTQIPNNLNNSTPAASSSTHPGSSEASGAGRQVGTSAAGSPAPGVTRSDAGTSAAGSPAPGATRSDAGTNAAGTSAAGTHTLDGAGSSAAPSGSPPSTTTLTGRSGKFTATTGGSSFDRSSRSANRPSRNEDSRNDSHLLRSSSSPLRDGNHAPRNANQLSGNDLTGNANTPPGDPAAGTSRELVRSTIQGPIPTKRPGYINDSALRAFTLRSTPASPIREHALYIKRNWQFGVVLAPDFASVNSLAGDKPGSIIGLTVDYQFAPRWYLSSGLLADRKNYAARSQDFHAPQWYYANNNINPLHVDFVKGSFSMLEIPLNLRYDFSVTGNTLFFASAGVSSYLLATENGNCYINWYGQELPKGFQNANLSNYLFSSANLSVGVETGISNSLSLLVAPYMKMPLGGMGFGQVQMSSVGIDFSLKWAPVTSRRRR